MKSIKPGRGPSAMGAAGSLVAIVFGVFWTIMAYTITKDAPFPMVGIIFPAFGVLFIIMGIIQTIYHYKNATGKERMSLFDITDAKEESDPLNKHFGKEISYCPYCGTKVTDEYQFCPKCGKQLSGN